MVLIQTILMTLLFSYTLARATTKKVNYFHHNLKIDISEVPFQTVVVHKNHYCSGSLISSRAVVTAAHCVHSFHKEIHTNSPEEVFVKIGSDTVTGDGEILKCIDVKLHEYYRDQNDIDNDIALLFLENHVHFGNHTKKIAIFRESELPMNKAKLIVTGYGYTAGNLQSDLIKLIYGQIEIVPFNTCRDQYGLLPSTSKFCAEYKSDTCMSDSACPATVDDMLLGIAVVGTSCAETEMSMPMIFINLTHYENWVHVNLVRFLQKFCTDNNQRYVLEDEFID